MATSCPGSLKASGRSNTALTTEKMAVFAPMPNASGMMATTVKLGCFASIRSPKRISCQRVFIKRSPYSYLSATIVSSFIAPLAGLGAEHLRHRGDVRERLIRIDRVYLAAHRGHEA